MIEPVTQAGRAGLDALLRNPDGALLAFDYDGTLSPIVDKPSEARPLPEVIDALVAISREVELVAIVTGRPAQRAVDLAGFADTPGLEKLVVMGHYGMERWDAESGELHTTPPPAGLARMREALPGVLAAADVADADVEDKGLSVAVHVRRLAHRKRAFARVEPPLTELARQCGLVAEPGRFVVELRPPGMDKGIALRALIEEVEASCVVFTGDDLGDLAAFAEVRRQRDHGLPGVLVCSGSAEVTELAEQADLVVDGPDGVVDFVDELISLLNPHPH